MLKVKIEGGPFKDETMELAVRPPYDKLPGSKVEFVKSNDEGGVPKGTVVVYQLERRIRGWYARWVPNS